MARKKKISELCQKPDEWEIVLTSLQDIGGYGQSTGFFRNGKMKVSKFGKMKDAIQSLFSQIAKPIPTGVIGCAVRGHRCLIEVIGPAGPDAPIWRFETVFKQSYDVSSGPGSKLVTTWKIRDPDTKDEYDPEKLVASDFCFTNGE